MLGVGSFSFDGWRNVRGGGVSGAALGMGGSVRGRDGVDAENVGSLTPNAREEAFATVGFLGVVNSSAEDLEGECAGGFDGGGSVPKVGGGWYTTEVGVRGEMGARGEIERDCDCDSKGGSVVTRVGRVPVGVLTVRGRGLSRSEGLISRGGVTCSTCCM